MKQLGARVGALAVRAMLTIAAVGCAVPAYRYAEVATLRANAPLEASSIAPQDAKALANALGSRFDSNPEFKPSTRDIVDIRSALVGQPLEPKLLGILGLAYEASGDPKQAAETMRVAYRASRRDVVSQLYLIESASALGDIQATLRYYNSALSTHSELNAALLPILSSAIAYPEIRTAFRPYLQAGAIWAPAFLTVAAEKGSVTDLQALLLPLPEPLLSEEYAPILANVLHRIAVEAARSDTLRFASAVVPGFSLVSFSNLGPDGLTLDRRLGPFAWTFPSNDGIQVQVGKGKSLQITADPLRRGTVAVRDFLLEPGSKYKLIQRLDYGSGSGRINARWSAVCITQTGTIPFWEQRLPISSVGGGYRNEWVVPQGCKVVRLSLFAEGPDGQMPATLALSGLLLSRLRTHSLAGGDMIPSPRGD